MALMFAVVRGWGWSEGSQTLRGLDFPQVPKEGVHELSFQLAWMWGQREQKRRLKAVSSQTLKI